jgi:putative SOS response-associated peptidase YedK
MRQLHDRQPVILDPSAYDAWLDPATAPDSLKPLLARDLDGQLRFHRVDRAVNTYKTQGGQCIEPINPACLRTNSRRREPRHR